MKISRPISNFFRQLFQQLSLRSQKPIEPEEAAPTEGVNEIPLSKKYFSTTYYDPSPHRFNPKSPPIGERKLPLVYSCISCDKKVHFKTASFERHCNSDFSNLNADDNALFDQYIKAHHLYDLSFLDFYCPGCQMPTKFLYRGGPSGYGGEFSFEMKRALLIFGG